MTIPLHQSISPIPRDPEWQIWGPRPSLEPSFNPKYPHLSRIFQECFCMFKIMLLWPQFIHKVFPIPTPHMSVSPIKRKNKSRILVSWYPHESPEYPQYSHYSCNFPCMALYCWKHDAAACIHTNTHSYLVSLSHPALRTLNLTFGALRAPIRAHKWPKIPPIQLNFP